MSPKKTESTREKPDDTVSIWVVRVVSIVALGTVFALLVVDSDAIVHGHPAYWVLLFFTLVLAVIAGLRSLRVGELRTRRRRIWRIVLSALGLLGLAVIAWLAPSGVSAEGTDALVSDDTVTVVESTTDITLTPVGVIDSGGSMPTAVLFQPGAKVDARAYVSLMRPLAEAGHLVVIPKQPLSIGFLAIGALDSARAGHPDISSWVVGGHSLGGTTAAVEATAGTGSSAGASAGTSPADVAGLFFYASYPATSIRNVTFPVLSISGDKDGLSTPAKIADSVALLPADTEFVVIPGANHAMFGNYGPQVGDGIATADRVTAQAEISRVTLDWLSAIDSK